MRAFKAILKVELVIYRANTGVNDLHTVPNDERLKFVAVVEKQLFSSGRKCSDR